MNRSSRFVAREFADTASLPLVLGLLVRAHHDQLVATARGHLGNLRRDAEDIVQDVLLAALEGELELPLAPMSDTLDALLGEIADRAAAHAENYR